MKKLLTAILALSLTLSLAACAPKQETKTAKDSKPAAEAKKDGQLNADFKAKEVTVFTDILDNLGNKDYFVLDSSGNTIKILKKAAFTAYTEKAKAITQKALTDNKIDSANTKIYTYYRNMSGKKHEKDYVIVFDANKTPTDLYEVTMSIDDKDEPAFVEIKKVEKAVDDKFISLFKEAVK